MNINFQLNRLLNFGIQKGLLQEEDYDYSANLLIDLLQLDTFTQEKIDENLDECSLILKEILDYAVSQNMIEDTITQRDLFDTRIMNTLMPRPSEVVKKFKENYAMSPKKATDEYYQLSIASQYIRKARTDLNIRYQQPIKYGEMEITINLSKPEKDPKEIAKAKNVISSGYPKCLLCKENVGFSGDLNRASRQTHRIIPLSLNGDDYYMQYSPYVYYNEHCIVFNKNHQPMSINEDTFVHLLSFIEQFPHYMLGSNADLPIVGGSILTHDHYQGGAYTFPIEKARILETVQLKKYPDLKIEIVYWPLSTVRVTTAHKEQLVDFSVTLLNAWKNYTNEALDIRAYTNNTPHHTITPIARMKDGLYQMDLVLRDNQTSQTYPDGIFHPHQNLHHIKKENIGLIEVMGLAVLPARLKTELGCLKECLLKNKKIEEYPFMEKHIPWYNELSQLEITKDNVEDVLKCALTDKFTQVLEDAGVFKMDETGILAFVSFVKSLDERKDD